MVEDTLSIIKPDGTKRNLIGKILAQFESENLQIVGLKRTVLSRFEVEEFYDEHKHRPFFNEVVEFMGSGPVVLIVLRGENAIAKNREIMGATNPAEAAEGTIRKMYSKSIGENTVHGSDSQESARREINFFFAKSEIC